MDHVRIAAIDPEFTVVVEGGPIACAPHHEAAVAALWEAEQAGRTRPLDDRVVLAYVTSDRRRLVCRPARLRDCLTGRRAPELFGGLPPVPIGLAGRAACDGRLVLGRRTLDGERHAGRWELVPCGALRGPGLGTSTVRLDVRAAFAALLAERTPLRLGERLPARPFALAFDAREPSWQLCVNAELELGGAAVAALESSRTRAYDAFRVVRPVDVIEAGLSGSTELAPLTAALVRLPNPDLRAAG